MKPQGFTLIELMICLLVLAIILALGIPSFSEQLKNIQTKVAMHDLLRAIESARTLAVTSNKRTVLLAKQEDWTQGWTLFIDENDDGELNGEETLKQEKGALTKVKIDANTHTWGNMYLSLVPVKGGSWE